MNAFDVEIVNNHLTKPQLVFGCTLRMTLLPGSDLTDSPRTVRGLSVKSEPAITDTIFAYSLTSGLPCNQACLKRSNMEPKIIICCRFV